jgi:hypothetical protein
MTPATLRGGFRVCLKGFPGPFLWALIYPGTRRSKPMNCSISVCFLLVALGVLILAFLAFGDII